MSLWINISFGYYSGIRNAWYIGENKLAFVLIDRKQKQLYLIFRIVWQDAIVCGAFLILDIKFVNFFRFLVDSPLFYICEKNQSVYLQLHEYLKIINSLQPFFWCLCQTVSCNTPMHDEFIYWQRKAFNLYFEFCNILTQQKKWSGIRYRGSLNEWQIY